jgi:thiol-disulfide isomerase/thioredoxin
MLPPATHVAALCIAFAFATATGLTPQCPATCVAGENCQHPGLVRRESATRLRQLLELPRPQQTGMGLTEHSLILFASPFCPFSAKMAPTYRSLAAAFPQAVAWEVVDVDNQLNSRFGVRSFPTLVLLRDGVFQRALYDRSLALLVDKVANRTGLSPQAWARANTTEAMPATMALDFNLLLSRGSHFLDPTGDEVDGSDDVLVLSCAVAFLVASQSWRACLRLAQRADRLTGMQGLIARAAAGDPLNRAWLQ